MTHSSDRRADDRTLSITVRAGDAELAERAAAEAWEAGASGIVESSDAQAGSEQSTALVLYAPAAAAEAVRAAVAALPGVTLGRPQPVLDKDWSQEWRRGLEAVVVGSELVVRPSWIATRGAPVELVIDPGQAFGTGGHASTRLALEWVEALSHEPDAPRAEHRVLDAGTGTGVLALAALALGAGRAVGFDLDPESGVAARHWAAHNGLAERFDAFVGPVDAIRGPGFDLTLANLLKRELLPIAARLAERTRAGGQAVFSGLLASESQEVVEALEAVGFANPRERGFVDANGDRWISLLMTRA